MKLPIPTSLIFGRAGPLVPTLLFATLPSLASPTSSGTGVFYDFTPDTTFRTDERYYDRFAGYYLNEVNQTNPAAANYLAPITGTGAPPASPGDFTAAQTQAPGFFMFNYKGATRDVAMARGDDTTERVPLTAPTIVDARGYTYGDAILRKRIRVFGTNWDHYYLNTNGSVSFGADVWSYSPQAAPVAGLPAMVAPFWSDYDTRTRGGQIWRRDASRDAGVVNAISQFVMANAAPATPFVPNSVQIITWDHVAYADPRNYQATFQLVLASDGVRSYAMMFYPKNGTQAIVSQYAGQYPQYGYQDGAGNFINGAGTRTEAMSALWAGGNTGPESPGIVLLNTSGMSDSFAFDNWSANAAQVAAAAGGGPADGRGQPFSLVTRNRDTVGMDTLSVRLFSDGYIFHRHAPAFGDDALDADGVLAMTSGLLSTGYEKIDTSTVLTSGNRTGANRAVAVSKLGLADPNHTVTLGLNAVFSLNAPQAFDQGTIRLADNSLLMAGVANAVSGGRILITDYSQLWLMRHNALSASTIVTFDMRNGGVPIMDMHGYNVTVGGLDSISGLGEITNTPLITPEPGDDAVITPLLTIDTEGYHDFSGKIRPGFLNAPFIVSLKKTGGGVQRLSGTNTFTGTTLVAAGTLLIGGAHPSATTVEAGATLGGSGSIFNTVDVRSGAHLAPGDIAGVRLTVNGGVTLADGAIIDLVLGSGATSLPFSGGTLTGPGAGGRVVVNLAGSTGLVAGLYTIIDAAGATISGFDAANLVVEGALPGYDAGIVRNGNVFSVNLVASAVPEPAVYGLLGAGGLAGFSLVARRRRPRRNSLSR